MAQAPPPANTGQKSSNPQQKRPSTLAPMRTTRFWVMLAILFAVNLLVGQLLLGVGESPTVTISYNTFLTQVSDGNVSSLTSDGGPITAVAKQPVAAVPSTSPTA